MKKFLDLKGIVTIVAAAGLLAVAGYAFDFQELKGEVNGIKEVMHQQVKYYDRIDRRLERIEKILME